MKHIILLTLMSTILYSNNQYDTLSVPASNSMNIRIEDFQFGAGFYMTYWISQNYGIRYGFGSYYQRYEYRDWLQNNNVISYQTIFTISPTVGILKRFMTRSNVAPYVGFESRLTWYIKNGYESKYTVFKPSFLFGVEAFVTDYISVSGEQSLTSNIYINNRNISSSSFGEGMLSVSLYF